MNGHGLNTEKIIDYFDDILDVLSEGVYISDRTGKTLKINSAYEKLTGLRRKDLMGRYVVDLVRDGEYDVVLNPEIVKTGKPKTQVQITKVGRQVVLEGHPVFDQSGQVALVVTFVRDITSLTQMKEQLAYHHELIARYNEVQYLKKPAYSTNIIAESKAMQRLLNLLSVIAVTDATVLLLGETGVGKDVLARKIHEKSLRADYPFFKVDCKGRQCHFLFTSSQCCQMLGSRRPASSRSRR